VYLWRGKDICLLGRHADLELLGMTMALMELSKVPSQ
jgi:hypothetical protein